MKKRIKGSKEQKLAIYCKVLISVAIYAKYKNYITN